MKLDRGDIKAFRKEDEYSLVLWKYTNEVTMVSTLYDKSTKTVKCIIKTRVEEEILHSAVKMNSKLLELGRQIVAETSTKLKPPVLLAIRAVSTAVALNNLSCLKDGCGQQSAKG
ncbi:hypothetical protein J6590_057436 [Homalodisca vitripennis]|nr:hypothetical protein J6590_057436 [Homalodisca vitripennis]